jgi:hypothetical protein
MRAMHGGVDRVGAEEVEKMIIRLSRSARRWPRSAATLGSRRPKSASVLSSAKRGLFRLPPVEY